MISFQHLSYLFDGSMKKPVKSALCHEMGNCLTSEDMVPPPGWKSTRTTYLVDGMPNVRKKRIKGLRKFADFCPTFLNMLLAICKNETKIRLVFDSYKESSVKDTQRSRRSAMKPIEIRYMTACQHGYILDISLQ